MDCAVCLRRHSLKSVKQRTREKRRDLLICPNRDAFPKQNELSATRIVPVLSPRLKHTQQHQTLRDLWQTTTFTLLSISLYRNEYHYEHAIALAIAVLEAKAPTEEQVACQSPIT